MPTEIDYIRSAGIVELAVIGVGIAGYWMFRLARWAYRRRE